MEINHALFFPAITTRALLDDRIVLINILTDRVTAFYGVQVRPGSSLVQVVFANTDIAPSGMIILVYPTIS